MNAKLRAKFKEWDRDDRTRTVRGMLAAIEAGDLAAVRRLLDDRPLIEWFIPHNAKSWAELAASAGQRAVMDFWLDRDRAAKKKAVSNDTLFFWAMGYEYTRADEDGSVGLAKLLLDRGAKVDGKPKADYTPLHRATFRNRPKLVELLIQRGADLARPYVNGSTALQIARQNMRSDACAKLLEKAGAPLEVPRKPERPKREKTIDLRESAVKLRAGVVKAVQRFAKNHGKEAVTAIALASIPHEGYVMVSFDTKPFEGSPWDSVHNEFLWVRFPDWGKAHEPDTMRVIGLNGKARSAEPDAFQGDFMKMIVAVLKGLEKEKAFDGLLTAKGCQIGIEMTGMGDGKFWKLSGAGRTKQ
jgi:ankyrin repeat protein